MPKTQPEAKEAQSFAISKIANNYNQFMLFDDAVNTSRPIATAIEGEYVNIIAAAPVMLQTMRHILELSNDAAENPNSFTMDQIREWAESAIRAAEPQSPQGRE